jgi:hypothetical protein
MLTYQVLAILLLFGLFSAVTATLLKRFGVAVGKAIFFLVPLFFFCLGFSLRLTEAKPLVDLGYFFTEFSYLFVYTLFAIFLFLGQVKYWKK